MDPTADFFFVLLLKQDSWNNFRKGTR